MAELDLLAVLQSMRRWLKVVLFASLAAAGLTALWAAFAPSKYTARVVLAAVGPGKQGLSLSGAASSLLGVALNLGGNEGIQATPDMVGYLLNSETVLVAVAQAPLNGTTISQAIFHETFEAMGRNRTVDKMRDLLHITIDRQTGMIALEVQLRDSTAARSLVEGLLGHAQEQFADLTRTQASESRRSFEARVDTAQERLREAEERLLAFNERNRSVPARSRLALERERLERETATRQDIYHIALGDRESARAKELEARPALVVVEAMPAALPTQDRQVLLRASFAGLGFAAVSLLAFFIRELLVAGNVLVTTVTGVRES